MFSTPQCPQCGMMHPKLPEGESCPHANPSAEEVAIGASINFTTLFNPLKTIVTSQIQSRDIKDHNKMFGAIIVEMTKFIENYTEETP
ncbi:hypothetical protein KAR91_21920, partial [Candidatus Pacearchaeota archaeon]|nr:hypothetical protein [Candidatus Pacearchaeota archaeon]